MNISHLKAHVNKMQPVDSIENLRVRIDRFFKPPCGRTKTGSQLSLGLDAIESQERLIDYPSKNIGGFLDFLADALPDGDVYLFGGILRDMALLGKRGFKSDIDLVVEGEWGHCVTYLESLGAQRNKFGGYRLNVADWPIDIWNARETWAIKQGLVKYKGIASLTETTVSNWDAILMNWRTKAFIYRTNYLEEIKARMLDIVLEQNPNPLGMAIRVFRHLCSKDAKKITLTTAKYLAHCVDSYEFEELKAEEIRSYGNNLIDYSFYRLFEHFLDCEENDFALRYSIASDRLKKEVHLF